MMEWVRGEWLGNGSFGCVSKALLTRNSLSGHYLPSLMAVKSSPANQSDSLKNEKEVLDRIGSCRHIIRSFGTDISVENGEKIYNLFLEFAAGGTLADQVKKNGGRLPESDIRKYTRAILEGLSVIHAKGFVHCDIKPQNILVFEGGVVKIADFGLAKEKAAKQTKGELRGTAQYIAPESASADEYGPACDVWALGLVVAEMATGKMAWARQAGSNVWRLLVLLSDGEELPDIPDELSEEGRDFLSKCFVKDPVKRWTAEMLLHHAFVADHDLADSECDRRTVLLGEDHGVNMFSTTSTLTSLSSSSILVLSEL